MHNYHVIVDRKIRLALVGCGRISSNHFDFIQTHSDKGELLKNGGWFLKKDKEAIKH